MESQHSFSFSSPESDAQNTTDIESQEYEMIYVAEKILENVNLMSFANMDFEEVRSMMRIREIARGIVEKNVKEVTDTDVDIAMLFALENMGVEFCRHADGILERLDYEGLEGGMSHTVSHIKEIVSTIVSKRAKLMVSRNDNPIELVDRVDAMTVESKVTLDTNTRNNCIDIWGIHKKLLSEKANIDAKTGNQRDTIGGSFRSGLGYVVQFPQAQEQEGDRVSGSSSLGFGDVQVNEEQYELVGNREAKAFHGVPFTQAEGSQWATIQGSLCFGAGDSQIKEEEDEGETEPKACTDAQFTEAEENPWDTTDRSLCSEVGHVHVKEENVLFINREAEACNLQSIQEDGKNQGITTDGSLCLGVGNAQVQEEEHVSIVDGEVTAWDDVRFPQTVENKWDTTDGTMFLEVRNVQVQEEQYLSVFGGEAEACNGLQFTQAEGKQGNTLDGLPCLGIGNVQVQEENVSIFNEEAEPCNAVQFTQGEGNQGNTRDGSLPLGPGNVQVHEEQRVSLVDGAVEASSDTQAEGILVENVDIVVGSVLSANQDENALREETFNAISEPGVTASIPLSIITWPEDGKLTFDWLKNVMRTLDQASKTLPPSEFKSVVPITVVVELMNVASHIFSKEPNCVEVDCRKEDSRVVVVGDIHGQFHDLLNLFELAGLPSEDQFYVFNGDYVDRGAWSLEVLLVMSAWKVLMPDRVYLLRGNHETKYCTSVYGFEEEVKTKFGDQSDLVYKICLEWFKNLPLASVISNCVFTAHGGLFRSMKVGPLRRSKRKRTEKLKLGSLEDLSKVNRYIIDVAEEDPSVLTDLLWSDPSKKNGLIENRDRGLGLSWGPDCTEMFLRQSKLKLIIRSHQGPDARVDQEDFGDMLCGYSMDHVGETGKLYTLFSAPSYPQFGETKFDNEGAYAVLTAPNFETPSFHSFKGVERPEPVITGSSSASREDSPAWTSSLFDTEALGISNLPSWSVSLADGTKVVQVPRAPSAEGLPLSMPSNLQETQRTAFEYLLELVAGLKLMLSSRA